MDLDDIIEHVSALDGVLVWRPGPDDGSPEISWGDAFFYYAPTGKNPAGQPYASIITKDYPDEPASGLDRPGTFRLNIGLPASAATPTIAPDTDPSTPDAWFAHPVYGPAGWICVIDPAERTAQQALGLLQEAHEAARARHQRRLPD